MAEAAGEAVAADEPLAELETDKVTLEVHAPASGTLAEILAEEGANVAVGAVLGRIADGAAAALTHPVASALGPPSPALRERVPSEARRVSASRLPPRSNARAGGAQADRGERARRGEHCRRPGRTGGSPRRT